MSLPPLTLNAWLRYDVIDSALRRLTDVRSILEIGCGQGALAVRLAQRYAYVGVELDPVSCAKAKERLAGSNGARAVCGELSTLDASEFDLVCAFEVLEHIEDDLGALREWSGHLRDGGWLLFSVPAYARRWGAADRMAGHFRRYEPERIPDLMQAAGFEDPVVWTYGFPLGLLLEHGRNLLAARQQRSDSLEARTAASGRWFQPPEWLAWGTQAATAPFRRIQRRFLEDGRGTGLVILARRADQSATGRAPGQSSPGAAR
jgi:SAM-dependent methyltransferase